MVVIFDLYLYLFLDVRLCCEFFVEVDKGVVVEWVVKKIIEKFVE